MLTHIVGALMMGLVGSVHCVAMCGPLAAAGCNKSGKPDIKEVSGYVIGRLVAYGLAGAVMGALGLEAAHSTGLAQFQKYLLVVVAVVMFVRGATMIASVRTKPADSNTVCSAGRPSLLSRLPVNFLPSRGLGLGMLTGALPCGLMMGAWMLAAASASPLRGTVIMLVFALASMPLLLVPVLAQGLWRSRLGSLNRVWCGLAWCALALWLGVRPFLLLLHGGHHHG
jgi:sulfite exporter TauE/SafE